MSRTRPGATAERSDDMRNHIRDRYQFATEEYEYMTGAERIAMLSIEDIATVKGLYFIYQLDDCDRELAIAALTGRVKLSPDQQSYFRDQLEQHYDREANSRKSDVIDAIIEQAETVGAL
jgi:hypothetical protein